MKFQKGNGHYHDRAITKDEQVCIVIFADDKILRTLRFLDGHWVVEGRLSTQIAASCGTDFEEPHVYYRNIGYLDPSIVYAVFDDNCPESKWEEVYENFTKETECSVSDICPILGLSCDKCNAT